MSSNRLSTASALEMWYDAPLAELGTAAQKLKVEKSGANVFYNRNIHLEPTNICKFQCSFCSYRKDQGDKDAWSYTMEEMKTICERYRGEPITEVHIVGGVDPSRGFEFYLSLIEMVKSTLPQVTVKAYTAVELLHIFNQAGITVEQGLSMLKNAGMGAIAGGGAEIFDPAIRTKICPEKCSGEEWLNLHKTAHKLKIPTNATMLYGHIESIEDRIDHLLKLRTLQDETGGFSAFIPLKFRTAGNILGENITECSTTEDLRMIAISRLLLDNFDHIKAYWPMFGKNTTELALAFGADDIDGTIQDTTKIYSMAGAEDQKPVLTVEQCKSLITKSGYIPIERDTFYNPISQQ